MASEISGLDPLHGYLKHGNLVVGCAFPYLELPKHMREKFIERKTSDGRQPRSGASSNGQRCRAK